MKSSTKILCLALALLMTSLITYDLSLSAEYKRGNFRNLFGNYVPDGHSEFNAISLQSGTAINLKIVKGPFKILIDPMTRDFVKVSQQGKTLLIEAAFSDHYRSRADDYTVFISCPQLKSFTSNSYYMVDGRKVTDTTANVFEKKPSLISGFNEDSLIISADYGSNVQLKNNHIVLLRAIAGKSPHSGSILTIDASNNVQDADFGIFNKSTLNLESTAGAKINYNIADSAKLVLSGSVFKKLNKSNQP